MQDRYMCRTVSYHEMALITARELSLSDKAHSTTNTTTATLIIIIIIIIIGSKNNNNNKLLYTKPSPVY